MHLRKIAVLLALLIIPVYILAKSGPAIPVPKLSISEAVSVAGKYFYGKETRAYDSSFFKKSEYIIISAEYTNYFSDKHQQEWAWKIRFVHPVQNDHSVTYKVTNDRQVIFLNASK